MIDCTRVVYAENYTNLLRPIGLGMVNYENQIGQRCD